MVSDEPPPRYAIGALLGGGESGEVFQARDAQTGEEVAYKVVAPRALPTPTAVERAQRELKQLMRAQSPRLAKVIDCGKNPEGRLYVVTELVAGEPLDRLIERSGAVTLDRAKKIVAQIGEALLEGQKAGVVHHDLCPKNVLVNAVDEVKVINFVVPRPLTETVFGVPEYLSPEQAEGRLVDQRSNTYSLGAIMTLLLTGAPPFAGETPQAVLEQVLRGEVPTPSHRKPDLTPEIDRVVMKALDKSSSRRPLTMRQFLNDVAALGAHPSAAATFGSARPAGPALAKTMMFAGGAPEVQKLVAEAKAARGEANGSGTTATGYSAAAVAPAAVAEIAMPPSPVAPHQPIVAAAPDPHRTPPPRAHGAAIAATMIAMPAASPLPGQARAAAAPAATPPPEEAQARNKGAAPPGGATGNFRETLWFKKGDVDQMVADAKAKAVASRSKAPVELPHEDAKPLEDRYVDDGSVTVEDRKNFSLRGSSTSSALPVVGGAVPGERMSESEMLNEMGGGKKITIIVIAVVVVAALVAVLVVAARGKGKDAARSELAAPPAAATSAQAPAPPAPPKAEPPPAPPAAAAQEGDGEGADHAKEAPAREPVAAKARGAGKKRNAGKKGKRHH